MSKSVSLSIVVTEKLSIRHPRKAYLLTLIAQELAWKLQMWEMFHYIDNLCIEELISKLLTLIDTLRARSNSKVVAME